jgi:proton-translocating NAD(P)+ transhydrogenase subunit beta
MEKIQLIHVAYFFASLLFLLGLRDLTHPDSARRGTTLAALGMLIAVLGTLLHQNIIRYEWIIGGAVLGTVIGIPMGLWIPMTKMPERIALSHSFGGLAVSLVGVVEYIRHQGAGIELDRFAMGAVGFEVLLGSLTFTGSLIAFGKLQGIITGKPVTFPFHNIITVGSLAVAVGMVIYLIFNPGAQVVFFSVFTLAFVLGVVLVIPIGGADMPVVICLLNSYAGLAASASGFALDNNVLIICGALDGGSGFILAMLMSKAMNRSFANVLFGAFGTESTTAVAPTGAVAGINEASVEDAAEVLRAGRTLIVVPGYGMAVAQAQHAMRELADLLEKNGTVVKYAIHPVAGRMPGHMNVLLAEANVPYEQLLDLEQINDDFATADVAMVVGANDVVNPAARNNSSSPIYGMPILNADQAKTCIVLKRSMNPGFAGIENELFNLPNTLMVFGDAKKTITGMAQALKA